MDELDDRSDGVAFSLYLLIIMSTWRCIFVDKAGYYKSDEGHSSSISFKRNIVKRYLRGRERKRKDKKTNRNRQNK
jgi:hypothetical protein